MKKMKLFCVFLFLLAVSEPAWSQTAGVLQEPDNCIVSPSAILAPSVQPRKKYVRLNKTKATITRAKSLAALKRRQPKALPVSINVCPPITPTLVTQISPLQTSLCRAALGRSASMTSNEIESLLVQAGYNANPNSLLPAMVAAMKMHPDSAPVLYAYALQRKNPKDKTAVDAISRAAYQAAPGQAAGLAYGGISANRNNTLAITQALLAAATPADKTIIRQCAVDANPNLANEIATAAFVPGLAQPELSAIGQNDIRNAINNAQGVTTLVPGLEAREKDDSAT